MTIQTEYAFIFTTLYVALFVCAFVALKSKKPIGRAVALLDVSLSIPIIANILILTSTDKFIVSIGYYMHYISMSLAMAFLVNFTNMYCQGIRGISGVKNQKPTIVYFVLTIDVIQLIVGIFSHHVIELDTVYMSGKLRYIAIPKAGLIMHRIINYAVFMAACFIFGIAIKTTTKVLREKFVVIFMSLLVSVAAQTYFIFFRSAVNGAMLAYAFLGVAIFHYSIIYKPVKLLDRLLSVITSNMDDAIFVFDPSGSMVWMNTQAEKLVGTTNLSESIPKLIDIFGDIRNQGEYWNKDVIVDIDGSERYLSLEKKSVHSDADLLDGSFLAISDSTESHKRLEMMIYEANHDDLTGLYNKKFLFDMIKQRIHESDENYYLVYVNIKNFKLVNDIFGNSFGDEVLIRVANWLKKHLSDNCLYGRLVADNFGMLIPITEFKQLIDSGYLSSLIIHNDNIEHQIFVHLGVYTITNKDLDVSLMLDRARLALADAPGSYTTCIQYYDDKLRAEVLREQQVISDFQKAIENDELLPYLQPISDVNGKIVGAEALARWIHPEKGFLAPISFIPIFEKNGVIADVDRHIWRATCKILSSWKDKYDDLFISINISPKDFYFIDVVDEIKNLIEEYHIEPHKLRVEITETALFDDAEDRIKVFQKLRDEGFVVEMDDFGSGYSSLNMLKDVSVDILKIDMKFLSSDSEKSDTIVKNVIRLANELNITALTEGVETEQQFKQLIAMGCKLFQGYYFAKPMPVEDFEKFVDNSRRSD